LSRLPTPFLPLHEPEIKKLAKLDYAPDMVRLVAMAGNRMGTARRCNVARLFLILRREYALSRLLKSNMEGIRILTRVSESVPFHYHFPDPLNCLMKTPGLVSPFCPAFGFTMAIQRIEFTTFVTSKSSKDSLILPEDFIIELKDLIGWSNIVVTRARAEAELYVPDV